jgi:hypothetical protein
MSRLIAVSLFFCLALPVATACYGAENSFILQGVVTTLSGEPAQGAEIYVYSSRNTRRPADFISTKSGKDGVYRLVLPRAAYWGIARIKKGERFGPLQPGDKHSGEPVKIEPDTEQSVLLDFTVADMQELAQRRGKGGEVLMEISGTVTANGAAVAGAYVYARTGTLAATLPEYFSAWTDTSGRYRLKLPVGSYVLGCDKIFPPPENKRNLREIAVAAGELPLAINLQLSAE